MIGVEPNAAMREAAELVLGERAKFVSRDGTAEETGLESGIADFVVAGQAFHWFDPALAARELRRVLSNTGWGVIIWNHRRSEGQSFLAAYETFLHAWGTDYHEVNHRHAESEALGRFFRDDVRDVAFPNFQDLDLAGLRARIESSSYMPGHGHSRRPAMMLAVDQLFEQHASSDTVRLEYDTLAFWGRV